VRLTDYMPTIYTLAPLSSQAWAALAVARVSVVTTSAPGNGPGRIGLVANERETESIVRDHFRNADAAPEVLDTEAANGNAARGWTNDRRRW
jgi:hypothetical protein